MYYMYCCIMYCLLRYYIQGADTASGTILQKRCSMVEFVFKILDKYTNKEFLKISF